MASAPWFEAVKGSELAKEDRLEQGDILFDFPIPVIAGLSAFPPDPSDDLRVDFDLADVVVMTQSCDLSNDKIERIIVAKLARWKTIHDQNADLQSTNYRKSLQMGNVPGWSLLREHDVVGEPRLEWSVVNFRSLHLVSAKFLYDWLVKKEDDARLRLKSPYKEHLSQAFARFFMRVGLPHDAADFIDAFKKKPSA